MDFKPLFSDLSATAAHSSATAKASAAKDEKHAAMLIERAEQAWREQVALDMVDEAGMESFPCSDPPSYSCCHV